MLKAAILGVAGALLAVQFKQGKTEYGMYIALTVGLLIFFGILGQLQELLSAVSEIGNSIGLDDSYIRMFLKMLGITYTAEFASGICRDAGYQTIAVQIELFAKLMILMLGVPVILEVLRQIGEFLS